jgi:dipeptidase D
MSKLKKNIEVIGESGLFAFDVGIILELFALVSSIDRASKREKSIADFVVQMAILCGHDWERDPTNNVVVYLQPVDEKFETICLQAHLDMVAVGQDGQDFDTSEIEFIIKDGELWANNTSLGADNGIGLAIMLSLMSGYDGNFERPIELLFTSDEETGFNGANAVDPSWISARKMINLDSEKTGKIVVGCAGGACWQIKLPNVKQKLNYTEDFTQITLKVSGLAGGHSGVDIHENSGNAIFLMAEMASSLMEQFPEFKLISINGGAKMNIIPQECEAVLIVSDKDFDSWILFEQAFACQVEILKETLIDEPGCKFTIENKIISITRSCLDNQFSADLFEAIAQIPKGVISRDPADSKYLQTSNNIGVIKTTEEGVEIVLLYRSSLLEDLNSLRVAVTSIFSEGAFLTFANADLKILAEFDPWEPKRDSLLVKMAINAFVNEFEYEPELVVSHGGLEPGCFEKKWPGLEAISIGPTIEKPHSQEERVDIEGISSIMNILAGILSISSSDFQ